jgi:hypothetical protein
MKNINRTMMNNKNRIVKKKKNKSKIVCRQRRTKIMMIRLGKT